MTSRETDRRIYSVSQLAGTARLLLEERFALVWVEGEISNLRVPGSGHWYFTLKDDKAQLRCAMFANRNRALRFKPRDGMQVILRGRVSLYEARGDFQLLADSLELAGEGALRIAFDALKQKLAAEGLFATERKRALPRFPTHLAVLSSRTGAALRDIIAVLRRRCPTLRITLLDVVVQGKEAEPALLSALARVGQWPHDAGAPPDVVLLARGGGSLEDLWAFNLESVARAIAACPLPVVSAIGHETDVTISDFVADLRAPTPSAAAELIAPDLLDWQHRAVATGRTLRAHWRSLLAHHGARLQLLSQRLTHPGRALQQHMQRLDDLERQLLAAIGLRIARARAALVLHDSALRRFHPRQHIAYSHGLIAQLDGALKRALQHRLQSAAAATASVSRALNAVSPLQTLDRGYAIVTTSAPATKRWGTPITSVTGTAVGATVVANLADGQLQCRVEAVRSNAE